MEQCRNSGNLIAPIWHHLIAVNISHLRTCFRPLVRRLFPQKAPGQSSQIASAPAVIHDQLALEGRYSYGLEYIRIYAWDPASKLRIGSFNSIALSEYLLGGNHRTEWLTTFPFGRILTDEFPSGGVHGRHGYPFSKGDIIIKNDVWIGFGCTVLGGVTIGNGSVLAAKSVVTKNVPDYAIVGGNPARIIRYRFDQAMIDLLLKIAWWDESDAIIDAIVPDLQRVANYEDLLKIQARIAELKCSPASP